MASTFLRSLRTVAPTIAVAAIAAGALVPAVSLRTASAEQTDVADEARAEAFDIELTRRGHALAQRLHGEAVARMHAGLTGDTELAEAATSMRIDAAGEFLSLVEGDDAEIGHLSAERASRAARLLDDWPIDEDDVSFEDLSAMPGVVLDAFDHGTTEHDELATLDELGSLVALPVLIADEAMIALIETTGADASPDVAEHVEANWDFVLEAGGWLASDGTATGPDAYLYAETVASESPDVVEEIDQTLQTSGLVEVDAWLQRLPDDEVPVTADELLAMTVAAEESLMLLGDEQFDAATAASHAEADAADAEADRRNRWSMFLFALGGLAGAFFLVMLAAHLRRSARNARLATVDQLTGVGTRHVLDDETAVMLANRRNRHHAVAVIDCDRFKLLNDLHGHDVGDQVLVEIARRLESAAAQLRRRGDARTTVVRLGGDEFLLSVHGTRDVDADTVRAFLDAERGRPLVLDNGTAIEIEYSIGVVTTTGAADLNDLMQQADLAVYEEKAERHARRSDTPAQPTDTTVARSDDAETSR